MIECCCERPWTKGETFLFAVHQEKGDVLIVCVVSAAIESRLRSKRLETDLLFKNVYFPYNTSSFNIWPIKMSLMFYYWA